MSEPPVDGSLESDDVGEAEQASQDADQAAGPGEPPSDGGGSSGGGSSGGGSGDGSERWYGRMSRGRKLLLPLVTLGLLVVILSAFHAVLLPFVFACGIVYLMEPIVGRLSPQLPRWTAVILVYLVFFGVISLSVLFMVPRFVSEIVRFAETAPEAVTEFRSEHLPGINERVQGFLDSYLPAESRPPDFQSANTEVQQARRKAAKTATATAVAQARGRAAADVNINLQIEDDGGEITQRFTVEPNTAPEMLSDFGASHGAWSRIRRPQQPVVRLVPGPDGSFELYMNEGQVEVARVDDDLWKLRRPPPSNSESEDSDLMAVRSLIDLEARVNELLESAISSSNERISALVGYAQALVVSVLQLLVAIMLTFMVAAFISIDLPSFKRFFRGMVPKDYREGCRELLGRVDRGLSGVIRGQLLICLVNGVLTYVGLAFLGIRFSLLLAGVAAVLSVIPIFGTVISTVPIVLVGLMDGFWTGLAAFGWILGIHALEGNILNPKIIGTSAHIHPVIIIFALLAGEHTFGLVGALLAVPVASMLLEVFKFARAKLWPAEEVDVSPQAASEAPR